jgi:tRNA(Ile)-lysidine synthase TilS/MesJ
MHSKAMLSPGARIGVAVSGGVDSFGLLQVLFLQKAKLPFSVELMVLHINPGFDSTNHAPLMEWSHRFGLSGCVEVTDFGPRAHSSENRKNSPCFFCSWHRRKRLFHLVHRFGLSHIAFGHTADDLVENFFMNMMYSGRIEGMFPKEEFFNGEFELIRPLLGLEKRQISKAVREWKLPVLENPCPSNHNTKRSEMRHWLAKVFSSDRALRKNIFSALKRWQLDND